MKINENILSLPPYISTTWQNISAIYSNQEHEIEIHLVSGTVVKIPLQDKKIIDLIFFYHSQSLENKESKPKVQKAKAQIHTEKEAIEIPLPFPFPLDGMIPFGQVLQHQPEQSNMPEIPNEILSKVASFAKTINQETGQVLFPDTQPHCNCFYCQIGRAVNAETIASPEVQKVEEEIVSDEDLKFKEWDVLQKGESLYEVTNPLDSSEMYQVFLGQPIGCTCGRNDCEHIKAALNTEI
jgi:hypothetical protein